MLFRSTAEIVSRVLYKDFLLLSNGSLMNLSWQIIGKRIPLKQLSIDIFSP